MRVVSVGLLLAVCRVGGVVGGSSDDASAGGPPVCVYHQGNPARLSMSLADQEPSAHLSTLTDQRGQQVNVTQCKRSSNFCYAFWQEVQSENNETVPLILSQGCWESSGQDDCRQNACLASKKPWKAQHQTQSRFCCCSGSYCNLNVSVDDVTPDVIDDPLASYPSFAQSSAMSTGGLVTVGFLAAALIVVLAVAAVWGLQSWKSRSSKSSGPARKNSPDSARLIPDSSVNLDNLKLIDIIGHGRYGTVWKASLNDKMVAVKVFPAQWRCYFLNERYIYTLPLMDHPNVVAYFGSQESVSVEGYPELRLVLDHAPLGCLQEYLRSNSLDWPTLCKMGKSVASGLAHLHTDLTRGDQKKPCVAHRDFNSRNILVKADLSLCLCDMGFAMQIAGAHYFHNGEEQHAETTSLTDVGTLRYMAPEVLEGAVNLRECESSLKQIDVYALGLVLWEIALRCADLYPSKEAPPYQLPFEAEIGVHPSIEQMKTLVCRHKARPLFPETWRDTNPAIRQIKSTLEDAWDQDAEARLTALCVEERWAELPILWERARSKNVTGGVHAITAVHQESDPSHLKNANSTYTGVWPPSPRLLQPHQGRNPCMERNTMSTASEEQSLSGTILVDRSSKHSRPFPQENGVVPSAEGRSSSSSTSYTPFPRVVNPIPYLQNAVHDVGPPEAKENSSREAGGISSLFSGFLRRKRQRKDHQDAHWEEKQSLCPVLSSPSDASVPSVVVVKSNNETPKATEVRWTENGYLTNVALDKAKCNLEVVEVGVAKQEAGLSPGYSPLVKRRGSWKETNGCDSLSGSRNATCQSAGSNQNPI